MKCRANNGKAQSQNKVVEFMMTATAYTLFEHGIDGEKILKILADIEDVADSMVEDYITFNDIRNVLKEEYGFVFNFN